MSSHFVFPTFGTQGQGTAALRRRRVSWAEVKRIIFYADETSYLLTAKSIKKIR